MAPDLFANATVRDLKSVSQPGVQVLSSFTDTGIPWAGNSWHARSAKEKQEIVWSEIIRQPLTAQSWPKGREFQPMFERSMQETMIKSTDMMPAGRTKLAHAQGAVALVRFIPVNTDMHDLSGLFRSGADYGIIRYSDTFAPNE